MPRNEIGEIVNSLPIEHMVAAPIIAAVKAQREVSGMLADYLDTVAMDSNGNARMLTFKYRQEEIGADNKPTHTERYIQAPFVALSGIPNLAVETVQVNFELEVNTSDTDKSSIKLDNNTSGKFGGVFVPKINFSASLSHSSEQTRQTDTRAKYSFHVEARKQQEPEALMRIVEVITNAATVPTATAPSIQNLTDKQKDNGGGTNGGGTNGGGTNGGVENGNN